MHHRRLTLLAAGALLVPAASASAHAGVSDLTPKPGSTVARSTATVGLSFSEGVLGAKLRVKDADGRTVSSKARLTKGKTRLRTSVDLHKGRFSVKATFVADDGHKEIKRWSFTAR